jgi:hypothetical protein
MDAVSALASLQSGSSSGGGYAHSTTNSNHNLNNHDTFIPAHLARTLSNNIGTLSYGTTTTSAAAAAVLSNQLMQQRQYSEDFTTQQNQAYFGLSGGIHEDHHRHHHHNNMNTNSLFTHPYHSYGPTSFHNTSGVVTGHSSLQQQQQVSLSSYVQQPPPPTSYTTGSSLSGLVPAATINTTAPTTMSSSHQGLQAAAMSMTGLELSSSLQQQHHHPSQQQYFEPEEQHAMNELSSSSGNTMMYHPLHPNDRPKVATATSNNNSTFPLNDSTATMHRPSEHAATKNDVAHGNAVLESTHDDVGKDVTIGDPDLIQRVAEDTHNGEKVIDEDEATRMKEDETHKGIEDHHNPTLPVMQKVEPVAVLRGKPEAAARALAAARLEQDRASSLLANVATETFSLEQVAIVIPKKPSAKKAPSRKKSPSSIDGGVTNVTLSSLLVAQSSTSSVPELKREFLLGEHAPTITDAEYQNLKEMMSQFCRVPLLSEFSRPVAMLHPEV